MSASRWFRVRGTVSQTKVQIAPIVDGINAEEVRARFPALVDVTVEELSAEQFRAEVASWPRRRDPAMEVLP